MFKLIVLFLYSFFFLFSSTVQPFFSVFLLVASTYLFIYLFPFLFFIPSWFLFSISSFLLSFFCAFLHFFYILLFSFLHIRCLCFPLHFFFLSFHTCTNKCPHVMVVCSRLPHPQSYFRAVSPLTVTAL